MVVDDEVMVMFVAESREHLAHIEADLLTMEEQGADIDDNLVNKVCESLDLSFACASLKTSVAVFTPPHQSRASPSPTYAYYIL